MSQGAVALALIGLLAGCAAPEMLVKVPYRPDGATVDPYTIATFKVPVHLFDPVDLEPKIEKMKLQRRADNLFVLVDQSASMKGTYRGMALNVYAREMFRRFNRSLPHVPMGGDAYRFPGDTGGQTAAATVYNADQIEALLDEGKTLPSLSANNLAAAIDRVADVMVNTPGRSALLLISRWETVDRPVLEAVSRLRQRSKSATGFTVQPGAVRWTGMQDVGACIYMMGVGNTMSRLPIDQPESCGFSIAADLVAQPRDMTHYVERLLFTGPADTDGDGIPDYLDRCPGSAPGRLMTFDGCYRFLSDADGAQTTGMAPERGGRP